MSGIKEDSLRFGKARMDYVCFGGGARDLVILPGLSDGIATVRGTGKALEQRFRSLAADCRVWVFSRKEPLDEGYTIRDMARDQAEAMRQLGIERADVMGVSQGGMVAQLLAADFPERIRTLTLVITSCRINETIETAVRGWLPQAARGDWRGMLLDATYRSYTGAFLKKNRLALALVGRVGMPKDDRRFRIQANAILSAGPQLEEAAAAIASQRFPVFVIGGDDDRIVGGGAAEELAARIPRSLLHVYPGLSHGLTEEAADLNDRILNFIKNVEGPKG